MSAWACVDDVFPLLDCELSPLVPMIPPHVLKLNLQDWLSHLLQYGGVELWRSDVLLWVLLSLPLDFA